jgi:hypothetical protein
MCSTLVLGGSTDLLELCWMLETLCLDWSWWFSPCHVMLLGPFPPSTHLNFSGMILQRLYLCITLVLGGSTDLLKLYWLWRSCVWAGHGGIHPVTSCYSGPSLHGPTSISLLQLYKGYICVPHWCWVVTPITWNFIGWWKPCCLGCSWFCTTFCHATWPFPPCTHLNFSVMIIQRLYLCSTLVFGGSTDLLELYRLWKPCVRLGCSWWFSPCHIMLVALPSMDPPQFLCYDYTKAILVFHIGVGW